MTFNIEEAVQTIQLKKVAKVLAPRARKDRKLDGLVKDLEKGKMPKVSSYKKNDDVVAAFAEVMGPEQTMKLFGIKEETYSPQKHEWGTDASRKFAKEKTPGEKKEKEIDEAKFSVDIEGLPRFYMDSDSPGKVKKALRSLLKKPAMIKDVERTPDSKVKADYRGRAAGKENMDEANKMKGKDPCWKGYEMVGTKKKNGKEVPNCVPKEETEVKEAKEYFMGGHVYKGTKHTYMRRGPKMTDPTVVYIDGKEWKTFKSLPIAKKETLNYIKGMKEEVEQVDEAVNAKAIQKMVDDGKSMDVIVGMFANKRTTNTDKIRKVVKDYMWKKRMKKEEVEQVDEAFKFFTTKNANDFGEDKALSYGRKKGYKEAGVIGDSPIKAMVLFHLKSVDKKDLRGANIKSGEQVFRYATRSTVAGDIFPLVKVNLDKGMVYYLTQESSSGDIDEVKFETRGAKLKFARMISDVAESVVQVDEALTMRDRGVLKAVRVAREMRGNMTGAVRRIEKMKKGLSDHPKVKDALRLANEEVELDEGKESIKKESFLSFSDYISEKKKLSPAQLKHMDVDDDNDIDGEDLAKIRAKKK